MPRARGEGEEAEAALSDLCEAYYAPVVAFLRREGPDEDAARAHVHAFFESFLNGGLGAPEPGRGRFRSYLLGALKDFLSQQHAAALAVKRGSGAEHITLLDETATYSPNLVHLFDREWALTLIARALNFLEAEQTGKAGTFTVLRPWLDGRAEHSQADAALTLEISETAVKVTIHRLRVRFRGLIRREIAATVDNPGDAAEELRHLIAAASIE